MAQHKKIIGDEITKAHTALKSVIEKIDQAKMDTLSKYPTGHRRINRTLEHLVNAEKILDKALSEVKQVPF